MMTANKRVTIVECCRHLGVDEVTLRSLLMSGRLPYIDLDKYLDDTRADRPPGVSDDD